MKRDESSDNVTKCSASETRTKRRCRQLVDYDETVDILNRSSGDESSDNESSEPRHQHETVTATNKRTTKRRSDDVAQMTCSAKAVTVRSVIVLVTLQVIVVICHCILAAL